MHSCISQSEATDQSLIFSICLDYIPAVIFKYGTSTDYEKLKNDLFLLNQALAASAASPFCRDLVRSYTCNYVYPGCNEDTGMPRGICRGECERYVLTDVCRSEFETLVRATSQEGTFTFTRQCNNTLMLVQELTFDPNDCINITGD